MDKDLRTPEQVLEAQMAVLTRRTHPAHIECFDAWLTVGILPGGEGAVLLATNPTEALTLRMEDEILALASAIGRRRERFGAGGVEGLPPT